MKLSHAFITVLTMLAFPADITAQPSGGSAQRPDGAKLYQSKCASCHSLASNKIGPAHRGVVGRKAGTYAGYRYSNALRASKIVWTPANLDIWLQGPQKMVKGSKMYLAVPNPADRQAIIAYLNSPAAR